MQVIPLKKPLHWHYLFDFKKGWSLCFRHKVIGAASRVSGPTYNKHLGCTVYSICAMCAMGYLHIHITAYYHISWLISRISEASTVSTEIPCCLLHIQGSKADAAKERRVPNLEPTKGPMVAPMPKYLRQFHARKLHVGCTHFLCPLNIRNR